jgi:hypothetical protein
MARSTRALWENAPQGELGLRITQHLQDAFCEVFVNFGVARDGLGNLCGRIVIPVVLPTVTNELATVSFELSDEIIPLH